MSVWRRRLDAVALTASHRPDMVVAIFLLLAITMMLIPMPTWLLDGLIALNISISLLVLIVAVCTGRPASFSALPPIILLATLFRLSLSISTSRLILLHADAGRIVETFGHFVIGGQVLIGLVIFFIITVAQFLVITKGAERVAEVAARFTLDAMPGKQMSIDTDLRNGDIDQEEARARRSQLERESQLYGAMDGAMKFVKGDAITGLVIVCINLAGGLLTGTLQKGMGFGEAATTYSLLTVGDGLIAQIPALMISAAAGTIVTRVGSDENTGLGTEIFRQLGASERDLSLAAAITCCGAFVPGFPVVTFLFLGGCFGVAAWVVRRRRLASSSIADAAVFVPLPPAARASGREDEPGDTTMPFPGSMISNGSARVAMVMHVGRELALEPAGHDVIAEVDNRRRVMFDELGLEVPAVEWRPDFSLPPREMRVDLENVPIVRSEIPQRLFMTEEDATTVSLLGLVPLEGPLPNWPSGAIWIDAEGADTLRRAGLSALEPLGVMGRCIETIFRDYAAHFVGVQETRELLTAMEAGHVELVREAAGLVSVKKLSVILRKLLEEKVSIGNLRLILEAIVEWAPVEPEASLLTERVRAALSRQISHHHAQLDRVICACILSRALEQHLRDGVHQGTIALPGPIEQHLLREIRDIKQRQAQPGTVLLAPNEIRRPLRQHLMQAGIDLPVLSYSEIAAEYSVQCVASVTLPSEEQQDSATIAPASVTA